MRYLFNQYESVKLSPQKRSLFVEHSILSSFAIILPRNKRERERACCLALCSYCRVDFLCLYLGVPWYARIQRGG